MRVLALDFSTSRRSVAVVQPRVGPAPVFQSERVEVGGRSTAVFGMIEQALSDARMEREAIECIAVGLGPGSYTGIRAAIAVAQGWQLAREIRLAGLGTLPCLAAQAHADGIRGKIHLVIDAQRGGFYCATWDLSETESRELDRLRLVGRDEVASRIAASEVVMGPDLNELIPEARPIFPSALQLGRLALLQAEYTSGEQLKPIYLRKTAFVKAPPPRDLD